MHSTATKAPETKIQIIVYNSFKDFRFIKKKTDYSVNHGQERKRNSRPGIRWFGDLENAPLKHVSQ